MCIRDSIHYIVTKLLAFGDNIHVVNSHLIIIFFVVHIQNILILQLITIIINFVFNVEGFVDVNALMFRLFYYHNHLGKCIVSQLHHEMNMLILFLGKVLISLTFPVDGTCHQAFQTCSCCIHEKSGEEPAGGP